MHVAVVALSCPSGGMLHYASQLANALAGRVAVSFFTPGRAELADYFAPEVRLRDLPVLNRAGDHRGIVARQANPFVHMAIATRILAERPDVVHFVTDHPCNGLVMPFLGDVRVCFTHHDPVRHPGEKSGLKDLLTSLTVAGAARIIVHGEALRQELAAQGVDPLRIAVIPHGDYGFLARHGRGEPEEPMILSFGRILPYKGLDVLCRAERILGDRLGEYRVLIAGAGDSSCFDNEVGPSGRVQVRNEFLSDREVASLFERARVVALPYTQASQSGVLAIAFAFGKPVVVTDVGGLPEAVAYGEAGLVVPAGDPQALAGAIESLWSDPGLRQRLGAAGKRLIEDRIGWPLIADRHVGLYEEAALRNNLAWR